MLEGGTFCSKEFYEVAGAGEVAAADEDHDGFAAGKEGFKAGPPLLVTVVVEAALEFGLAGEAFVNDGCEGVGAAFLPCGDHAVHA